VTAIDFVAIYLVIGFIVANASAEHKFTLNVNGWLVVFWLVIPIGWVFFVAGLWMAQDRRR